MANVALVATLTAPLSSDLREIKELPDSVAWLQWRADLTRHSAAARLRSCFSGKLLYTLQSTSHGGAFTGPLDERQSYLIAAVQNYDLLELEAETDLTPELLDAIPPRKRIISWSGPACDSAQLHHKFRELSTIPAHSYCLAFHAASIHDGLQALLFLKELKRTDVTAFCTGPFGLWSRLLSPFFGAPFLFGQPSLQTSTSGEPSLHRLIADYGFPALRPLRELYGMVGNKVFQSPSPRLHNTGYGALNHPALFLPFHVECFEDFWRETMLSSEFHSLGLPIQGLTIVSPHKEAALAAAELHGPMVDRAGATNVFVRKNNIWEAHTTDPESVAFLHENQSMPRKAAVIGCGGAGRAIAATLQQMGMDVTLVNRGKERGTHASRLLGLPFVPLSEFKAESFFLLINATPVGREDDTFPFAINSLRRDAIVVDLAYGAHATPLVAGIEARGGTVMDGYDVVLTQVRKQFEMMTGLEMPRSIDRDDVISGGPACSADSLQPIELEQEAV
jgi:3-dehydroquinate dehydratase / shikimate dehydrogenase